MSTAKCWIQEAVKTERQLEEGESATAAATDLQLMKKIEEIPLMVIKKNNERQVFNRDKIFNGILKACEKKTCSN